MLLRDCFDKEEVTLYEEELDEFQWAGLVLLYDVADQEVVQQSTVQPALLFLLASSVAAAGGCGLLFRGGFYELGAMFVLVS